MGKEHNFVCSSKLGSDNQRAPRRICCYVPSSTNSSQQHKFTTTAYPMSPTIGRRSRWRSFAASLNLENGPAPSDSTSSSSEQTTDGDASENLLSKKLSSDEVSVELKHYIVSPMQWNLIQCGIAHRVQTPHTSTVIQHSTENRHMLIYE